MSTILKQLKLTAVPRGSNPIMDQRMRLMVPVAISGSVFDFSALL